jgi:hypothetical protein
VISAVNSVLAVMLNKFVDQSYVSVITSILALITGIIGSVELFLKINDRMDIELTSSKHYYLLQVDIFRMLNLDRKNRNGNALDYLNEKIESYMKLFTASNIKQKYIRDYLIEIDPPFSKIKADDVDSIDIEIVPARPARLDQLD